MKEQEKHHEQRLSERIKRHKNELSAQRKEIVQAGDLAENRLMRLLDQERREAKASVEKMNQRLVHAREDEKSATETSIELKTQAYRLEEKLTRLAQENTQLKEGFSGEKVCYEALQSDFQVYQTEYSEDGKLEELHASIW